MEIPCTREAYENYSADKVITIILTLRKILRYILYQTGHDRCWIMYQLIYCMLEGSPPLITKMPKKKTAMRKCKLFYEHNSTDTPDKIPSDAILDHRKWDEDIKLMKPDELKDHLVVIINAIKKHQSMPYPTVEGGRELFSMLPEKIPADFTLPNREEFLYGINAAGDLLRNAGCEPFWDNHKNLCSKDHHDFEHWAPCTEDPMATLRGLLDKNFQV